LLFCTLETEAPMGFPNESRAYRKARDLLLREERQLAAKVKSVAAKRRKLPLGGQLQEDYVFQWANDGKVGRNVRFSQLFGGKDTLLLYSFMYGPSWDKPCPSCTSLMDGFDRTWYSVSRNAAFVAIAKAPARKIHAWARKRGWSQIPLVSGFNSTYQADYGSQGDSDDKQLAMLNVFRRRGRKIFHFWGQKGRSIRYGRIGTSWTSRPRPARHSDAAAEFQARILREALSGLRRSSVSVHAAAMPAMTWF
jgi:predicted dithiol-disulfide oxidoreductase (DUF899 family)